MVIEQGGMKLIKTKRAGGKFKKRTSRFIKFRLPKDEQFDYKNIALLQKFLTERGKLIARRVTGITSKQQRQLTTAIKRARYLGLLPSGGTK